MRSLCCGILLLLIGTTSVRAQDPAVRADSAWRAGEVARAEQLYAGILAADSADDVALHRMALLLAWRQDYAASLRLFDRLLRLGPDNLDARVDRARVLTWSGRTGAAAAAIDSVLAREPGHAAALQARAQFRSWSGDLIAGERAWRAALAAAPDDLGARVGLAQVLRWQGRDAAAYELLRDSPAERGDVREQLAWVRANIGPRVAPSIVYERDSDENEILSISASAAVRPTLRSQLRADAYARDAQDPVAAVQAWGGTVTYWRQLEPGWNITLGAGASATDVDGAGTEPVLSAGITSPARDALLFGASLTRSAVDATAAMIRQQVRGTEAGADLRWRARDWNATASAGFMKLDSRVSGAENGRWNGTAALVRTVSVPVSAGVRLRAYGYSDDRNDGYFDPELYALGEVTLRYLRETRHWSVNLEGAPGAQRIARHGEAGTSSTAWRTNAQLAYVFAPGRRAGVTFAAANSGMQQLSAGAAGDYRYLAFGLAASWTF